METFSDRAKKVLSHFQLNENSFSKRIGKSYTGVVKVVRGDSKPNLDMIESILEAFPALNPSWLVAGEGEMLREAKAPVDLKPDDYLQEHIKRLEENFSKLANQLEKKDEQIENLHEMLKMALGKYSPGNDQPKELPFVVLKNVA
jgi:uncharacterized protein YydD (DUF2326 family)